MSTAPSAEPALTGTPPLRQAVARLRQRWADAAFVASWEVQSHLSSIAILAFVALVSPLAAIPAMLVWSLVTTIVFHWARHKGRPDLLERTSWGVGARSWRVRFFGALWGSFKAWIAGVQAFLYSRTFCAVLEKAAIGWRMRAARAAVLAFGLTVFGVPTAHHILRRAGYEKHKLLRMGLLAPFLNVPFRVFASAVVFKATISLVHMFPTNMPMM